MAVQAEVCHRGGRQTEDEECEACQSWAILYRARHARWARVADCAPALTLLGRIVSQRQIPHDALSGAHPWLLNAPDLQNPTSVSSREVPGGACSAFVRRVSPPRYCTVSPGKATIEITGAIIAFLL